MALPTTMAQACVIPRKGAKNISSIEERMLMAAMASVLMCA